MAKIIRSFNMDFGDMGAASETRSFTLLGDANAIFSLEIKNEDSYYYNFDTRSFGAAKSTLKRKSLGGGGKYSGVVQFPSISDNDQYDIYLWAEHSLDTEHTPFSEVRFGDDTLDINSSTGSNSTLVQKVIYQYTDTTIAIRPTWASGSSSNPSFGLAASTADTIVVPRGKGSGKQSFSITIQTSTTDAVFIKRQPAASDFFKELYIAYETSHASSGGALTGNGPVLIQGENPWTKAGSLEGAGSPPEGGLTRGSSRLNMAGNATDATRLIVDALPTGTQVGDRLTGWVHSTTGSVNSIENTDDNQVVTISAINPTGSNANQFDVDVSATNESDGLTIADDHMLYFDAPYYHRYQIKAHASSYGVLGLSSGLQEPAGVVEANPATGTNGNMPNTLASYEDAKTYTREIVKPDGSIISLNKKVVNLKYPAIDTTGYTPTVTNGKVTAQNGIITFLNPQKIDCAVPGVMGNTWFYARGLDWVKQIHNTEIRVSNLKVELTKPTTTTTSGVSSSATIPVADREGTIANVSTISGIGIAAGSVNPTITSAQADGAGSWTASAAQTLENGITLTVENTSRNATITGDIEVINCGHGDFNCDLDITKFLDGS